MGILHDQESSTESPQAPVGGIEFTKKRLG